MSCLVGHLLGERAGSEAGDRGRVGGVASLTGLSVCFALLTYLGSPLQNQPDQTLVGRIQ